MSLKQGILEQAKTALHIFHEYEQARTAYMKPEERQKLMSQRFVSVDAVLSQLDKATEQIKQKTVNILNHVNIETGLTIIEKGNIKRFLSYYTEDVLAALGGENQK